MNILTKTLIVAVPSTFLAMHAPYLWMLVALAFLLLEAVAPGLFFFISFAIGAVVAACVAVFNVAFAWQCAAGLLSSVLAFFSVQYFLKRGGLSQTQVTQVGTLVGLHGTVTREIGQHSVGQVKVGGEVWSATSIDGSSLTSGIRVRILRIEGNKLIVSAVRPK